jgi:hypothetical protein
MEVVSTKLRQYSSWTRRLRSPAPVSPSPMSDLRGLFLCAASPTRALRGENAENCERQEGRGEKYRVLRATGRSTPSVLSACRVALVSAMLLGGDTSMQDMEQAIDAALPCCAAKTAAGRKLCFGWLEQ